VEALDQEGFLMVKFNEDGIWTVTLEESIKDTRASMESIQREFRKAVKRKKRSKNLDTKRYWAGKANGLNEGYQWVRQALLMMEHQEGR
jgi:hypothetical protein